MDHAQDATAGPDPVDIARQEFDVSRRGYHQQSVRGYLREVSSWVAALQRELADLHARAERAEARAQQAERLDDARLLEVLGEETTRVLISAREAAAQIRAKAEEAAAALVSQAQAEAEEAAARVVAEAEAAAAQARQDAEAELEAARARGREMVNEAQALRDRVLGDLRDRRQRARQQVEKLSEGRERIRHAYRVVRRTLEEAEAELEASGEDVPVGVRSTAPRALEGPEEDSVDLLQADLAETRSAGLAVAAPAPEGDEAVDAPADEPAPQAQHEPAPQPDPEPAPQPEHEPATAARAAPVDDLFARLRAEQDSPPPRPTEQDSPPPRPTEGDDAQAEALAAGPPTSDSGLESLVRRDNALAPIEQELLRRLKRTLADEQNQVLDLLRRAKPASASAVLPPEEEHLARWEEVAAPALDRAAAAGAGEHGGSAVAPRSAREGLARALVTPLRERVERAFAAADGDPDEVADRARALYREWKGKRLVEAARHELLAAYEAGVHAALPEGCLLRWVVDRRGDGCPDAEDNLLAGALAKGERFPTGHTTPPAHPGCRCHTVPAEPVATAPARARQAPGEEDRGGGPSPAPAAGQSR